jgi:hypothetical protein
VATFDSSTKGLVSTQGEPIPRRRNLLGDGRKTNDFGLGVRRYRFYKCSDGGNHGPVFDAGDGWAEYPDNYRTLARAQERRTSPRRSNSSFVRSHPGVSAE